MEFCQWNMIEGKATAADEYHLQSAEWAGDGVLDLDNSAKSLMRLKPEKMCPEAVT